MSSCSWPADALGIFRCPDMPSDQVFAVLYRVVLGHVGRQLCLDNLMLPDLVLYIWVKTPLHKRQLLGFLLASGQYQKANA